MTLSATSRQYPVRLRNVTKIFGGRHAVDDLSLDIAPGEMLVLLGPSGSGKTTTLRMLAGLERADAGEVFIGPDPVNRLAPKDRDIAMVFQDYALYPHMTVFDNIAFPLRIRRTLSRDEIRARVERAAGLLAITPLLPRRPGQTSGGEQQRVALARAIVREPRAFLMDEPLANLDAKLKVQMRTELKLLHRQLGITTICVSHDQLDAMTLGSRIAIMSDGRLRQVGTPDEVYHRPVDTFVAGFLGTPAMNFFDGALVGRDGRAWIELAASPDGAIALPSMPLASFRAPDVTVGIRPERVRLASESDTFRVPGKVTVLEPVGSDTYGYVALDSGSPLVIRMAPEVDLEVDQQVAVTWREEDVHVFDRESGRRVIEAR